MADIMHMLRIDAPTDMLHRLIATAEGIRLWWTADAKLEPAVGGNGSFGFYGGNRRTAVRVIANDPGRLVVWEVTDSFRHEWAGTSIRLALDEADNEGSILRFAHCGFSAADDDYAICTTGWGIYLGQLKQVAEGLELLPR